MRLSSQVHHFILGVAAIVSLASCSGGGSPLATSNGQVPPQSAAIRTLQTTPTSPMGSISAALVHPALPNAFQAERKDFVDVARINAPNGNQTIVSDSSIILVYGGDGHLNALIHKDLVRSQAIATDSNETLYVADLTNLLIYPKPYNSPPITLSDPSGWPEGVAVSPTGLVASANIQSNSGGDGSISIFPKGATTPCVTDLSSPYVKAAFFDAFDAAGNLYFDGFGPMGNSIVGEVTGGCNATKIKMLQGANNILFPGGVQVVDGHLLIEDQESKLLSTYNLPKGNSLGSPTATTGLYSTGDPIGFAMRRDGHRVWVADAYGYANADEYTYPRGTLLKSAYGEYVIVGIAVNPAASP
jgi:hypothetical protein